MLMKVEAECKRCRWAACRYANGDEVGECGIEEPARERDAADADAVEEFLFP
jgi:hypothetical protein